MKIPFVDISSEIINKIESSESLNALVADNTFVISASNYTSLAKYIKKIIPSEKVQEYLSFYVCENNILDFSILISHFNDKELVIYYYYLLVEELISVSDIDIITDEETLKKKLYLFITNDIGITATNNIARKNNTYLKDLIPKVYYGTSACISYKDEDNIKEEFANIIFTADELALCSKILGTDFNLNTLYKAFMRINDNAALIEKHITIASCILNYKMYQILPRNINSDTDTFSYYNFLEYDTDNNIIFPLESDFNLLQSIFLKISMRTINY